MSSFRKASVFGNRVSVSSDASSVSISDMDEQKDTGFLAMPKDNLAFGSTSGSMAETQAGSV